MAEWRKRAAAAAICALLTVIATYAVLRGYDVLFNSEPNPAVVTASVHIAMFWRLLIGSFLGGAVAILAFFATGKSAWNVIDFATWAVPIVAALITLQGLFLP